jgi:hypothetical protein
VEYAEAGFVGLLGVLLLFQDGNDVPFTVFADIARPIDEPFAAPLAYETMVRWHMVGQGGIAVFFPVPCMYGEPFVLMVDLDDVVSIDQLDLFAYMP